MIYHLKKYLLLIIPFFINNCFAQDTTKQLETIKQKNRITQSVTEIFNVLKADRETKQGIYQAVYNRNTALASGLYGNNKRKGMWHFYDTNGNLVENFNYDNGTLTYEEPMNAHNEYRIAYAFDKKYTDSDVVTKPIKPGGRCYGYIHYLTIFELPNSFADVDLSRYSAILELLVSPGGRLADIKVHIRSSTDEYITEMSTELVDEEDRIFIPATMNRQPILSRIFLRCRLTLDGALDVY
jgi:hypothetical protein